MLRWRRRRAHLPRSHQLVSLTQTDVLAGCCRSFTRLVHDTMGARWRSAAKGVITPTDRSAAGGRDVPHGFERRSSPPPTFCVYIRRCQPRNLPRWEIVLAVAEKLRSTSAMRSSKEVWRAAVEGRLQRVLTAGVRRHIPPARHRKMDATPNFCSKHGDVDRALLGPGRRFQRGKVPGGQRAD